MACNCKTVKKLNDHFNANGEVYEKKGTLRILKTLNGYIINILNTIILSLIVIIMTPIILVTLLFNIIFRKNPSIPLPTKFFKNKKYNEKSIMENSKKFVDVIEPKSDF